MRRPIAGRITERTKTRCGRDDSGIALIAVLWGVTLLALIAAVFSSSIQIETRSVTYQRDAAQAYGIACGGVEAALFEIGYPTRPDQEKARLWNWQEGQSETMVQFPGGRAVLKITPETAKLDLNAASGEQFARLFVSRGLGEEASQELAAAILHWRGPARDDDESQALDEAYRQAGYRPGHGPFGSVEEVLRVRGMSREIFYGTLAPTPGGKFRRKYGVGEDLTVFSKVSAVNINYASRAVLESAPDISPDLAVAVLEERANGPFRNMADAGLRLAGALPGESLPYLTTASADYYTIVSVGEVAGSRVRRAVKAVLSVRSDGSAPPRIVLWYDEDFLHGAG